MRDAPNAVNLSLIWIIDCRADGKEVIKTEACYASNGDIPQNTAMADLFLSLPALWVPSCRKAAG
jgi:hypothetical protein